jgi:transposase
MPVNKQEMRMHQAKILTKQGLKQYKIAEILGVSDRTVRNYLSGKSPQAKERKVRESKLDPYKAFIKGILSEDPLFNCEVINRKIKARGYRGGITILRDYAAKVRKEIQQQVVIRFESEPGYQAQMDWKELPRSQWKGIYAFVMVLGYSRSPFVYFTNAMSSGTLLQCHQMAFKHFTGIPQTVLYDNMKTAWVFRQEQWHPNSRLLAFASFCGFAPKRCAVRRPQSKGKVERFIGYLTSDFLSQARLEGLKSAAQLNARMGSWLAEITEKKLRDFSESRQQRFAVERQYLQPLTGPDTFDCRDSHDVFVSREGFITFETNSYSVPPIYVGSRLVVKVDRINQEIEIVSNGQSIRTVPMLAPFSKSRYVAREDQIALLKVWQSQRNKPIAIPTSRKKSTVAVEIRQPAYYDALVCERGLS